MHLFRDLAEQPGSGVVAALAAHRSRLQLLARPVSVADGRCGRVRPGEVRLRPASCPRADSPLERIRDAGYAALLRCMQPICTYLYMGSNPCYFEANVGRDRRLRD